LFFGLHGINSAAHAQTFEVGYELSLEAESLSESPQIQTAFFVYASHDFFLFDLEKVDTQFYISPSLEIVFGDRWWLGGQFLIDSPIATPVLSAKVSSQQEIELRASVILTPFD